MSKTLVTLFVENYVEFLVIQAVCLLAVMTIFKKARFSDKLKASVIAISFGLSFLFGCFLIADDTTISLSRQAAGAFCIGAFCVSMPLFAVTIATLILKSVQASRS